MKITLGDSITIAPADHVADDVADLAATVRKRRIDRTRGGLGLIRLTAESGFRSGHQEKPPRSGSGEGGAPAEIDALPPLPIKPQ